MNYKELEQEVKRLEEQIKDLKVKLEEKVEKKAYEVEYPKDLKDYYYVDELGGIYLVGIYLEEAQKEFYKRGLAFKTRAEAEQFDKERILINKLKKWAKKYNGGWTPNWKESDFKFFICYFHNSGNFHVKDAWHANAFHKLPFFKSEEIAREFIEEFGEQIKEVLC